MPFALSLDLGALYCGVYEIGERLGAGGTGTVFRARHVVLQQERALKVLHRRASDAERTLGRLQLEASVFGRLKGEPSLVMPLDVGFDQATDSHFLAMELLVGCDLATWVHERGPLDVRTALAALRQVSRGVDAAHRYVNARGVKTPIVHRDLTPTNVFLVQSQQQIAGVKILDFGLAEILEEPSRKHGRRSGTPLYRSYEQAMGLEIVPQTDIWGLGLLAYFALVGGPYWLSRSASELHEETTARPLERPSVRLRQQFADVRLPVAFDDWLLRCLHRLPARRFPSAGEAIDELELCLRGAGLDFRRCVVSAQPAQASLAVSANQVVGSSRTVSRLEDEPTDAPPSSRAASREYLCAVHPLLKAVVRLADDLMTASGHYLAFAPASSAVLAQQLAGVDHSVQLFNAASRRIRGPIGGASFAGGIDSVDPSGVGRVLCQALSAVLALPVGYASPEAADAAHPDPLVRYSAQAAHWQTERVRLQARVEMAKRALDRAERHIEAQFTNDTFTCGERAQAAQVAERLIGDYVSSMRQLGEAIEAWLCLSRVAPRGGESNSADARALREEAWQLASPIEAMNNSFVLMEERSLELRVKLLGSEAPGHGLLAEACSEVEAFQWYEVRPQLNGLLVNVIQLLTTESPAPVAGLVAADRPGWEKLRRLLARARFN